MYSADGISWTTGTAASAAQWYSVTYGGGKFVAVANASSGSQVMYSTNGTSWTSANAVSEANWYSVTYGGGKFVAVSYDTVMYSSDGISWQLASPAIAGQTWYSVTYGDGKFVAVASAGSNPGMYSTDGANWYYSNTNGIGTYAWKSVTYGNGKFVAVGPAGTSSYSTDGINWNDSSNFPGTSGWNSVTYGNGLFLAVTNGGAQRVGYSEDGINWTLTEASDESGWMYVVYGNDKFVAVANSGTVGAMYSFTGTGIGSQTLTFTDNKDLANFRDGDAVNKGTVLPSIDAGNNKMTVDPISGDWTAASATSALSWYGVTYGLGSDGVNRFVAVAGENTASRAMYSLDGINWTQGDSSAIQLQPNPTGGTYVSVTSGPVGDYRFAACGSSGKNVMASTDGITWTAPIYNIAGVTWEDIAYGDGKYVIVGQANKIAYSNGVGNFYDLIGPATPGGSNWYGVTYGDGKFVAVGDGNPGGAYSTDGVTWTPMTPVKNGRWSAVTYGELPDGTKRFVVVSENVTPRTAYSADGINWTSGSTSTPNWSYTSVTYSNGYFVAVSDSGYVIFSSDGINWEQAAPAEFNSWNSVTYGDGKFVSVSLDGTNQVMWSYTGGASDLYATTETVTGPLLTAPTGVFGSADVSAKTMALTSTDATGTTRWVVGSGRTVIGPPVDVPDPEVPNVFIDPGETMYIRGTTGSSVSTDYFASIKIGNTTENWTVKTTDGSPEIQQPSIVLPVNGATGIVPDIELVSSSYVGLDSPGSHASSAWQVYQADSASLSDWSSDNSPSSTFSAVAFGNNRYVAVGYYTGSQVKWSIDGVTWNNASQPTTGTWTSVAYGGGTWVAVAFNVNGLGPIGQSVNRVIYSTDNGANWIGLGTMDELNGQWQSVTYGDGKFVAVATSGGVNNYAIMYSTNGINWTGVSAPTSNQWRYVTYGNGKFVAIANDGSMYSTDGINWFPGTGVTEEMIALTYGDGMFVAVGSNGDQRVLYSTDGIDWTLGSCPIQKWRGVSYGNGEFVACAKGAPAVMTSPDGINWTTQTVPSPGADWRAITFGNNRFVCVSMNSTPASMYLDFAGKPSAPTTEPPDASVYTTIVDVAADTTNLIEYPLTDAQLSVDKVYFSRVQIHLGFNTSNQLSLL